ncbi:patatin-like phospholipase family protein [Dubosiella newyorkensis]|uniref:patatin-like phospholipase family protein n=1 Tax=Dubosiella newyorkensis TaxID=1862672 RepID=UPI00248B6425|nr:patatin-like phospholipase family protein [Dubosiella newyorkensis]
MKALVFGGGGSKGSYEVGVCQALNKLGYTFDLVTGVSIGALCGAIYVQQDSQKLVDWINTFQQKDVSESLFMFPNQYSSKDLKGQSADAFFDLFCEDGPSIQPLITRYQKIFDFDRFMGSHIDYACLSYNMSQQKPQAFYKSEMTKENVIEQIFSSTAYFPAFNLIKINGEYYADGGYAHSVPYELAQEMGATSLIAIDISDFEIPDPFQSDENHLLIRPLMKLKYYLDFSGADLTPQIMEGYLETLKYLNKAPGYLYTFYEEDWKDMLTLEKIGIEIIKKAGKKADLKELPEALKEIYTFLFQYVPRPLNNKYWNEYILGRVLEAIGYICGLELFQQYHFKDFLKQILIHLENFNADPNTLPYQIEYRFMEMKGARDLIVFFHSAFLSYGLHLPEGFDKLKEKYLLPYYIAIAWIVLDKCRLLLDL